MNYSGSVQASGLFMRQTDVKNKATKGPLLRFPHVTTIWGKYKALKHTTETTETVCACEEVYTIYRKHEKV